MKIEIEKVDKEIKVWIHELKPGNLADPKEPLAWTLTANHVSRNQVILATKIEEYSEVYDQACNAVIGHVKEIIEYKIEKELKLLKEQQNEL